MFCAGKLSLHFKLMISIFVVSAAVLMYETQARTETSSVMTLRRHAIYRVHNISYSCTQPQSETLDESKCLSREISKKICQESGDTLCEVNKNIVLPISTTDLHAKKRSLDFARSNPLCCQTRQFEFSTGIFGNCKLRDNFEIHCPFSEQCFFTSESASVCSAGEYLCYCDSKTQFPCPVREPTGNDISTSIAIFVSLVLLLILTVLLSKRALWLGLVLVFLVGLFHICGVMDAELGARDRVGFSVYVTLPHNSFGEYLLFCLGSLLLINLNLIYSISGECEAKKMKHFQAERGKHVKLIRLATICFLLMLLLLGLILCDLFLL